MAVNQPTFPDVNTGSAVGWFAQWLAILLIVFLLAKSNWGRPIVYYMIWLAIVLLVLGHSQDFADILAGKGGQ
jgi:hypothetical protein